MKLLIAIPALDEEESIGSIIERCLAAREHIIASTPVTAIDITVVSDGSTDRTVEIARGFEGQVSVIVFERNRGYGAAITEAWRQSDADLLSFLDADGTCDPNFFVQLCNALVEREADIALGCRLNRESRMPALRRFGNTMFAWMLSIFSLSRVRDAASGMRVVRRTSVPKLYPLPTGLHFTPAMSARALLSRNVTIIELDMPYHEREGESKLNPLKDGIRFLRVILQTAFLYRPSRPLGVLAVVLVAFTALMMITPTMFYLREGRLEEWMIYRCLVGELLATIAALLWFGSYLGRKAADIALSQNPVGDRYHGITGWLLSRRWFWIVPVGLLGIGVAFVGSALVGYLRTGEVTDATGGHWSRFVAMMFCFSLGALLLVTRVADYCLNLLALQLEYEKAGDDFAQPPPKNG